MCAIRYLNISNRYIRYVRKVPLRGVFQIDILDMSVKSYIVYYYSIYNIYLMCLMTKTAPFLASSISLS
jgi:hypothetical protein